MLKLTAGEDERKLRKKSADANMEGRVRLYLNIDSPASIKLAEKQQIP